ncbi:MAG: class I SAM-dependent methyltransferase [Alphaproteobacteria bacterium]
MAARINTTYFVGRTACPVCGGADVSVVYSCPLTADPVRGLIASHYHSQGKVDWSYFEGTDFDVAECKTCDLIYQLHVPNNDVLDYVYNRMVEPSYLRALEQQRLTIDNFNRIAGELAVLFRITGKHPSEITFLDYGSGYGRWARVARALGATVFATETGEEKKRAAAEIGVKIIADSEIGDTRFDIVHTEQVLEHLSEPGREFGRLAASTGSLFKAAVPSRGRLRSLLVSTGMPKESPFDRSLHGYRAGSNEEAFMTIQPLEHLNAFSGTTMKWLANKNALTLVSRVRNAAVAFDMTTPKAMAASLTNIAKMAGKMVLRPEGGYYLFRPQTLAGN